MLAVALGLGSSLCWGLSDFFGGLQSRRLPVLAVMFVSQLFGTLGLAVVVLALGESAPGTGALLVAMAAGAAGAAALAAFYRGLAIGTMSIVAPISATGAALPVIVGLAQGERPSALQLAGIALAMVGVVLASREGVEEDPSTAEARRLSVVLALLAALGIGLFFVGIDSAAESDDEVLWVLLAARGGSMPLLLAAVLAVRPGVTRKPADLAVLAPIGLLDVAANGLFAFASTQGLLSVVGVLSSLYPAVTILLARTLLGERIRQVQGVGVLAALAGVVLIASG